MSNSLATEFFSAVPEASRMQRAKGRYNCRLGDSAEQLTEWKKSCDGTRGLRLVAKP